MHILHIQKNSTNNYEKDITQRYSFIYAFSDGISREYLKKMCDDKNNKFYLYTINDIITDNGFISTTRDPFYSPGLTGNFGLTLLKIYLPKGIKGIGLFIENFSFFQKNIAVVNREQVSNKSVFIKIVLLLKDI